MTIAPDHLRQRWNTAPALIQSILDKEKTKAPFTPVQSNPRLISYREQVGKDLWKAKQEKHISATVYYTWLLDQEDLSASVEYERFRGSWAHSEWVHKPEVLSLYQKVIADQKRFQFLR